MDKVDRYLHSAQCATRAAHDLRALSSDWRARRGALVRIYGCVRVQCLRP